jgi:Cu/Ag efflux pump CusA
VESALNGAPGIRRLRSVSGAGIAVVWVEFEWGQDIYRARQVVAERLQAVSLPAGVERPTLGPISSIMGEITFIALTSESVPPMELRRVAETQVRRRLLALTGISQVVPIGGDVREYLVELDPAAVVQAAISVEGVVAALEEASACASATACRSGSRRWRACARRRSPRAARRHTGPVRPWSSASRSSPGPTRSR